MEISTDGYLHKKFKKQSNNESVQIVAKDQHAVECIQSIPFSSNNEDLQVIENTNTDVPKFSTNNENVFLAKSSISHIGNSIGNINNRIGGLGNSHTQSFNNCISYVISSSDRVEDINQRDTQNRAVSFDRRFNILEPIASPIVETSSILANVYSKQYVTSKLVSVENIGDISSSSSNIISNSDHTPNIFDESSCTFDRYIDNQVLPEQGVTEKSSGGKYVCSYCNLACSKPSVLQKHIRAHTNERPYPCVSCGFSFKTRSNLYKHCRSRTHANRVMGNKAQEIQIDGDSDSQSKLEYIENSNDDVIEEQVPSRSVDILTIGEREDEPTPIEKSPQDLKTKPYKPRFHTVKSFFEEFKDNQNVVENQIVTETVQHRPSNSQLLSLHINNVINKNNAIVNSGESYLLRKRSMDTDNVINEVPQRNYEVYSSQNFNTRIEEKRIDEPLNLTNKIRKRCISEVTEPAIQTSLIKELLLKNLYADPNMQCPHCKMIFQTVTELELHKMRSCKAFIKTGARYSRSSSVNVASILTKNKNAFDTIPYLQNTVFPLKSPGPFLGKTRLVDNEKTKCFSFDDNLPVFRSSFQNPDILRATLRSSISPLMIHQDRLQKTSVKLFGGEVKITQTSGETKSFKIDNKEPANFTDYSSRLSENRLVKSSLQSGGTVLQNRPSYNSNQDSLSPSPHVIRVYENNTLSPSIDLTNLDKNRFNFDRLQNNELLESKGSRTKTPTNEAATPSNLNTTNTMYNYTNIMDFSQNAAKLLAPNLKQPNLAVPGIPIPSKVMQSHSPSLNFEPKRDMPKIFDLPPSTRNEFAEKSRENEQARHLENMQFAQNQIFLQQKMALDSPSANICNPVNLLVNGKVIRYVPGMPGPIAADPSLDLPYANSNPISHSATRFAFPETVPPCSPKSSIVPEKRQSPKPERQSPILSSKLQIESEWASRSPKSLDVRTNELQPPRLNELKSPSTPKSPMLKILASTSIEAPRKFTRPNTLALKPSTAAHKQHHGLTPTMFNQILISPDTPRVAKKYIQHFLHGNYFSYLGLKSSTKSVYCTLNKTQQSYVPHFKKLSMYSEWRQQETKGDKLHASAYDSRQRKSRYTTAGKATADLVVHSSYKFTVAESLSSKEDDKGSSLLGGYESNEEYTYVRGRGRGRYICDQCGIRCKKPSMLKKHIRTHTNDRPYTCSHCNFSFKTKGNLTKHMKSKAHTKNYAASGSSNSSAHQSGTQSSDSDTDDSGMDSSDESTRQQEHEAAYGLLSLSQKTTQNITAHSQTDSVFSGSFMNAEQVTQVNNTNFAKNKILDKQVTINFNKYNVANEIDTPFNPSQNLVQFLGKTNIDRPLTYPYTSDLKDLRLNNVTEHVDISILNETVPSDYPLSTYTDGRHFAPATITYEPHLNSTEEFDVIQTPIVKVNDTVILSNSNYNGDLTRKRKIHEIETSHDKYQRTNTNLEAIDLSMTSGNSNLTYNGASLLKTNDLQISSTEKSRYNSKTHDDFHQLNGPICKINRENKDIITCETPNLNISHETTENNVSHYSEVSNSFSPMDYDNSAMETLADVATKQVKLEKHILAKNVASEFLKLTSKNDDACDSNFLSGPHKEVNDLIGKPEENKNCTICEKNFNKPSQLRLHMNIHYLERRFRCDPCSTSFRTKGHLQKHERSAGHHNKLSSPLLSSSEPRPFKCTDCRVGFRIHGHLAKHLRSKQHIMKLEWLSKIPIGLYAELERANSLLTEINTTDGDQCLESLKALARKVFVNDSSKPNQTNLSATITDVSDS